jgi:alpha-L-fucosidase
VATVPDNGPVALPGWRRYRAGQPGTRQTASRLSRRRGGRIALVIVEHDQPNTSGRPTPEWYADAKFGIFIHWGLYSVPGFAPPSRTLHDVSATGDWEEWFRENAYAEWYWNTMQIEGSSTAAFHAETYGEDFPYEGFREPFEATLATWDPGSWAEVFRRAGARYVVLTTKHHDGYRLWPSSVPNPAHGDYHPHRDLVGDLAAATRTAGLRFGTYYSGGVDWTFNPAVTRDQGGVQDATPEGPDYVAYADAHWRELIARYQPSLMWNDISYPAGSDLGRLFADYYAAVPDGIINDRFSQHGVDGGPRTDPPYDITTPEYTSYPEIRPTKWETCRGIGFSFGYNRMEDARSFMSADEIVHLLVDVVSKNGNLLLNTGPMGDGQLQPEQVERLLATGEWLAANGEAIYATRPWVRAEASTDAGGEIRFTAASDALFATFLGQPVAGPHRIDDLDGIVAAGVTLLATGEELEWRQDGAALTVVIPDTLATSPAHSVRISSRPERQP